MSSTDAAGTPAEVFYVVQSVGLIGDRQHHVSSVLYETRRQAETELARLRSNEPDSTYSVWQSISYTEPHQWVGPVVLANGTVVNR
jgi:hypothetical protein